MDEDQIALQHSKHCSMLHNTVQTESISTAQEKLALACPSNKCDGGFLYTTSLSLFLSFLSVYLSICLSLCLPVIL